MKHIYKNFINRHTSFRGRAETIYLWPSARPDWEFKYLSISLLSDVWSNWCKFCRSIIINSCRGTVTRHGNTIPIRIGINSWQRIAYEAKQATHGRAADPTRTLSYMRQEPTWGDQGKLLGVIRALSPFNASDLTAGFGLSYVPKHLQKVRNACFHLNAETMADVRGLLSYYSGKPVSHPVEIIWLLESSTKADAIFYWLDELEIIADVVTQ